MKKFGENKPISCFFCQGEIQTIYRKETRTSRGDHYCGDREYEVKVVIPAETNLLKIAFEPTYDKLLEKLLVESEAEVEKIIDTALNEVENVLTKYNNVLGYGSKISASQNFLGMYSPEERRARAAKDVFSLRWAEYNLENVDEVVTHRLYTEHNLIAHERCIKPDLALNEIVSNPIIAQQFKGELAGLPEPMQNIYEKLKNEKVDVKTESYDFRAII